MVQRFSVTSANAAAVLVHHYTSCFSLRKNLKENSGFEYTKYIWKYFQKAGREVKTRWLIIFESKKFSFRLMYALGVSDVGSGHESDLNQGIRQRGSRLSVDCRPAR